jgi:hypothetical protein
MNRLILPVITASALIFGFILPSEEASAQMTAKDLVGTWTLASIMLEQEGKKTNLYGPNPQGQLTFDRDGRFSVIITRSDLPKFVSNDRRLGTPEENKAIVQGSFAYFGSYSVSETDKTFTTHIESCTFPNWNGIQRETSFNISGDEVNTTSTISTGVVHSVWKRAQ